MPVLRPARTSDVHAAIPLIYSSGPAALDYIFSTSKRGADDFIHAAFVSGRGELGYHHHVVAEDAGEVIGIGASFTGEGLRETFTMGTQILRTFGLTAPSVITRGLRFERIVVPPRSGEHCVAHLGVAPGYRGQGIGTLLIQYLLDTGRVAGRSTAILDVSVENPRAQALYERLGFAVMAQTDSRLANKHATVVAHRRMALEL